MIELLNELKKLDFLKHLDEQNIIKLSSHANLSKYAKGDILFYEGDECEKIFFILKGELKFYKTDRFDNEIFLYYLKQGYLITDTSNFFECSQRPTFSNAEFSEDSILISFESEYLLGLIQNDPIVERIFCKYSYNRIKKLEYVLNRDIIYDATAKVADMILNDIERFNALKKTEIAYELHIQPETLSRVLAKLARNEYIKVEKNIVKILNLQELEEMIQR